MWMSGLCATPQPDVHSRLQRLEKEIRRESERYDSDVAKTTANMTKLGKGGSSEALAKVVGDLNGKVKEHEVKRSEMMTDADDFAFKRQVVWIHAFASFVRAHQGYGVSVNQRYDFYSPLAASLRSVCST